MESFVTTVEFEAFKLQNNERFDRLEGNMEAILNVIIYRLPPASAPYSVIQKSENSFISSESSNSNSINSSSGKAVNVDNVDAFSFEPITPVAKKSTSRQVNFSIGNSNSSENVTSRSSNSVPYSGNLGGSFGNYIDQRAIISIPVFGETLKTSKLSDYLAFKKKLLTYNASYSQQVRLSRCLDLSLVQDIFASFPDELGNYNENGTFWIANSTDADVEKIIGRLALPRSMGQYYAILKKCVSLD